MVIPIAALDVQDLLLIEKVPVAEDALAAMNETDDAVPCRFRETTILGCVFVPLVGEQGYPE